MSGRAIKRSSACWAIDTNPSEGHGFLGILCWFDGAPPVFPRHVEGNRTATWRTRREAREALARLKAKTYVSFPRATVRRVRVTVEAT